MNKFIIAVTVWVFTACGVKKSEKNEETRPEAGKYAHLLSLYQQTSFDTLKVYSTDNPDSSEFIFRGTLLDKQDVLLLPEELRKTSSGLYNFYACYQFKIDSCRLGLITRTPAEYNSSSIKLLIHDTAKQTFTDFFELADTWGDAGDYYDKDALLVNKYNNCNALICYTEGRDSSVENQKDTTVTSTTNYYMISMKHTMHDTIARNTEEIIHAYKSFTGSKSF